MLFGAMKFKRGGFSMHFGKILCIVLSAHLLFGVGISVQAREDISVDAKAVVVMEASTGRVLYSQNAYTRMPIASTTKIMTALLALEHPSLHAQFEADAGAIRVEGSSMGLRAGDRVTLYSLAQGMLLASGNDAANAAAVRMAGSIPAFSQMMNAKAREIGMYNTSFVTPSGLDADGHYSTAFDMALLTRHALRNSNFAEICSQYRMRSHYGNPPYDRWLVNHNKLLNYYEYAIGVKTGFTRAAGRCLVSAARWDGITLIIVTLTCPDDWNTHERLYELFFPTLELRDISDGLSLPQIPVTGGTQPYVNTMKFSLPMFPVPAEGVLIEYNIFAPAFLYAPLRSGQSVGHVEIVVDGKTLATLSIISACDVPLLHPYREQRGFFESIGYFFTGLLY